MKLSPLSFALPLFVFGVSTLAQGTQQSTTSARSTSATTKNSSSSSSRTTGTTGTSQSLAPTVAITGGGESDTATGPVPTITGGADATDNGELPSGLPTLTGAYRIVPASVPPTAGAPYMQQSALPEGTVFIAVGAILGFLAMSVLLWRGLVAWSLHRSVKRASQHTTMSDTKSMFGQSNPPLYSSKYADRDSMIDLSGARGKGGRKSNRPTTAPGAASTASLFFSPTAGAIHNSGNRGSNYLPAGYYAAGSSAPANNQSHVTVGQGPSISLSNLAHQSQGYTRARSMANSPPESPVVSGEPGYAMQRSSTLNLNRGYGGDERAPSAYLDDLFDATDGVPSHPPSPHRFNQNGGRF